MNPILSVRHLKKQFPIRTGWFQHTPLRAVDGVSFEVRAGETVGLVGESGSGKSTTGLAVLRLIEPSGGAVLFEGEDITKASAQRMQALRQKLQMVFQDPLDSLNPRLTVGQILAEPLVLHGLAQGREVQERTVALLRRVKLGPEHVGRYPHQLSGGQRQRVGIARALATKPRLVVLDEPTSALDVSVQAQLLNLLRELQAELNLAYLFISHDLAVVSHLAERVAVMYLGQIVEFGPTAEVFSSPRHPYTQALLSAIPGEQLLDERQRIVLSGEIPSPLNPPSGCRFHTRCPFAQDVCRQEPQTLRSYAGEHGVACGRAFEGAIPPFAIEQGHAQAFSSAIEDARSRLFARRAARNGGASQFEERPCA
jgi:oligopeptide/dipeptide ABC transporter ATP-binding protein